MLDVELCLTVDDVDAAVVALDRAAAAGCADLGWLAGCPLLEPLRSDARSRLAQRAIEHRAGELSSVLHPLRDVRA
jgi:hypothetical protein